MCLCKMIFSPIWYIQIDVRNHIVLEAITINSYHLRARARQTDRGNRFGWRFSASSSSSRSIHHHWWMESRNRCVYLSAQKIGPRLDAVCLISRTLFSAWHREHFLFPISRHHQHQHQHHHHRQKRWVDLRLLVERQRTACNKVESKYFHKLVSS